MAFMGICNCCYKIDDMSSAVALPGAISLNRDSNTEIKTKRIYTPSGVIVEQPVAVLQNAPRLQLDVFSLPVEFLTDILNYSIDSSGVMTEYQPKLVPFTLFFETYDTDKGRTLYRYDKCYCQKPNFDVSTIADVKSLSTHKINIIATNVPICTSVSEYYKDTFDTWISEYFDYSPPPLPSDSGKIVVKEIVTVNQVAAAVSKLKSDKATGEKAGTATYVPLDNDSADSQDITA